MMQSKTKLSLVAIIAIAGLTTGLIAYGNEETVQLQEVETVYVHGSLPDYSVDELAEGTKYAIIGKVKEITPVIQERENRDYVFSDVKIKVKEDLFGDYDEKYITVRILGGQVDNLKTVSELDATFELNEKALFFVAGPEPESIWGDSYYVAGLEHGKYKLENGKAKKSHSNGELDELDLKDHIKEKHNKD